MEKWKLKSYIKTAIVVEVCGFLGFALCFTTLYVLQLLGHINVGLEIFKTLKILLILFLGFTIISIIPAGLIYIITNAYKKKNEVNSEDYYRDIESKYTPAIASLLLDYKIEGNESLLATVLDLHVKKYLNIYKKDKKLEIEVINENTQNLYLHEKYIINCLKQNELIEVIKFQNKVEEDCIDSELVNRKELRPYWFKLIKIIFIINIVLVIALSIFPNSIVKNVFAISVIINVLMLVILSAIKRHIRTTKGEEIALKFKQLKNFLKDYTLLSERDINYINISDRYLPFALALGIANKLENSYIECNKLISNYVKQ